MADVLIRGMEMPTSCNDCRFAVDGWCYVVPPTDRQPKLNYEVRTNWCPLIEVPPHGDLIDINALKLAIVNVDYVNKHDYLKGVLNAINNAPTIIPADKESEA